MSGVHFLDLLTTLGRNGSVLVVEATHGVRQGHRTVALVTVAQRLIVILHHRPWIGGASIGTWTAYSVYLLFPPKPVDFFRSAEVF